MRIDIDLDAAAAAGIIGEDEALRLRKFQADQDGLPVATAEKFALFGGYADIMAAMGAAIMLAIVAMAPLAIFGDAIFRTFRIENIPVIALFAGFNMAIGFGLMRLVRRLPVQTLPAVTIVLYCAVCAFWGLAVVTAAAFIPLKGAYNSSPDWLIGILAGAGAMVGSVIFWRKTRLPIIPAAMSLCGCFMIGQFWTIGPVLSLMLGLIALTCALWWDISDVRRETERSQIAFWPHCAAGLLIARGMALAAGGTVTDFVILVPNSGWPILLGLLPFAAILSLFLDRRSLLMGACIQMMWLGYDEGLPWGVPLAGIILLGMSIGWGAMRRRLLGLLPPAIVAQVPRVETNYKMRRPTRQHLPYWSKKTRTAD